jgi:hypothetical protein
MRLTILLLTLLSGCASAPVDVPETLPDYPCKKVEAGRVAYYACSDQEWLTQQILEGYRK